MTDAFTCLIPGCEAARHSRRGHCPRCSWRLANQVRRGRTTWEALEAAGESLPFVKTDYAPAPEEIAERAAAIRAEWCDGEYEQPTEESWGQRWEREYFASLDTFLAARRGGTEARQAWDAYLSEKG